MYKKEEKVVKNNDKIKAYISYEGAIEVKEKTFEVCMDDDNVNIVDWIQSHFENGNWHKSFEVTVSLKEFDYTEDGEHIYLEEE